jgi:hypothetical protein
MARETELEQFHAKAFLWRLLEELPPGGSLVFSRTGQDSRHVVLLRPGDYDVRARAANWGEATRRVATEAAVELVRRKPGG